MSTAVKDTEKLGRTAEGQTEQAGQAIAQIDKQEVQEPTGAERTRPGRVYTPAVDIFETHDAIVLVVDMPGVDESGLEVTLEKNLLTIYGSVDLPIPAGHNLAYAEYGIGDYRRTFTISNQIDWEHIEGTVKNGVLKLVLPKAGPAQTKKIAIKTE